MGRFLLGILCAAALWFGYQAWFAPESSAEGQVEGSGGPGAEAAGLTAAGMQAAGDALRTGSDPGLRSRDTGDVEGGDPVGPLDPVPAVGEVSWRALLTQEGPTRSRAAAALVEAAGRADTAEALVALLGRDNAFVHSPEGREVAGRVLRRLDEDSAVDGLGVVTDLFELCAAGPIRKTDDAARAFVDDVRHHHRGLARRTVLDPANIEGSKTYDVQPGDTLIGIAAKLRKELGVPLEHGTLQVVNRIDNPQSLRAGQRLKVPMRPVRATVFKRSFLVAVYVGDQLARTYWCAHGREQRETPETAFVVREKISEPDWHPGGRVVPYGHPDNPLGTLFVKFEHPSYTGFGIHGTWEPESIGTMASRGCIRLSNDDIDDFARLVPSGAEVVITR